MATLTPLQRPKRYGDKLTITPEEAQAIAEYWASNLAKDSTPSDPDREAPPEGGAEIYVPEFSGAAGKVGGYNAFYVDIGESNFKLDGEYRTSIITRPANGRMPSLSPKGIKAAQHYKPSTMKTLAPPGGSICLRDPTTILSYDPWQNAAYSVSDPHPDRQRYR